MGGYTFWETSTFEGSLLARRTASRLASKTFADLVSQQPVHFIPRDLLFPGLPKFRKLQRPCEAIINKG
jgi:hypothetical protein